jgi:hypothetical protein
MGCSVTEQAKLHPSADRRPSSNSFKLVWLLGQGTKQHTSHTEEVLRPLLNWCNHYRKTCDTYLHLAHTANPIMRLMPA